MTLKFTSSQALDKADEDAETVARVRAALDRYWASHGPGAMVAVSHVRDLLDPRGMWSLDPEYRRNPAHQVHTAQGPPRESVPGADPITGCLPVTPSD